MKKTKIDYLTHTWNPLAMRCDPVSAGCDHCWHLTMCERMAANPILADHKRQAYRGDGVVLDNNELASPLSQKKAAVVGVQFMGDLFHQKVHIMAIGAVMEIIKKSPQHQFLVLTKRPKRILSYHQIYKDLDQIPNLWLGVSIEDQATADQRIPLLLEAPIHNRFLSIEPMLGPVDLSKNVRPTRFHSTPYGWESFLRRNLHWIITGGESGAYARPLNPEWVRSLRNQCKGAGVPFYHKQNGEWEPVGIDCLNLTGNPETLKTIDFKGNVIQDRKTLIEKEGHCYVMSRIGKKRAGHLIAGEEVRELPAALKGVLS